MTIRLCQPHYLELYERWGGRDAIERAYGEVIIDAVQCEALDCITKQTLVCPHCYKLVRPSDLIRIKGG